MEIQYIKIVFILQAQPHLYAGHSAPISSVTFSSESNKLFSAGGKDTAILQWKIV